MIAPQLLQKIKMIAPGTPLRKTMDEIVKADLGSLLVFLDDIETYSTILQGGFNINCGFSRQRLYELAKMDGAIIIGENVTRIHRANVHLIPDSSIPTNETGMRHSAAERFARHTNKLTVAISRRRKTITVYYGNYKHQLNDLNYLITRVNLSLSSLERNSEILDQLIHNISLDEMESEVRLRDIITVILKAREIMTISDEIEPYVIETGSEGYLSSRQLEYTSAHIKNLLRVLIMDYAAGELKDFEVAHIIKTLKKLDQNDKIVIAKMLGWNLISDAELDDILISPRCYRLLTEVANIPMGVARNVIKIFDKMAKLKKASLQSLQAVEGIGEKRAYAIIRSINIFQKKIGYR